MSVNKRVPGLMKHGVDGTELFLAIATILSLIFQRHHIAALLIRSRQTLGRVTHFYYVTNYITMKIQA